MKNAGKCSGQDCNAKHYAFGFCRKCYQQRRRRGAEAQAQRAGKHGGQSSATLAQRRAEAEAIDWDAAINRLHALLDNLYQ